VKITLPQRQGHSDARIRRQAAGSRMGWSQSLRCKLTHYPTGHAIYKTIRLILIILTDLFSKDKGIYQKQLGHETWRIHANIPDDPPHTL
jgi:hypothetical protein